MTKPTHGYKTEANKLADQRKAAIARFDKKVVRLEDTAHKLIRLLDRTVDSIQESMFEGLGYKGQGVNDTALKQLKEATAAFNSATDAQIRLDKTAAQRAKSLTMGEKKAGCREFILGLPPAERSEWIRITIKAHEDDLAGRDRGPAPDESDEGDEG
jgi:hypothetical protein